MKHTRYSKLVPHMCEKFALVCILPVCIDMYYVLVLII